MSWGRDSSLGKILGLQVDDLRLVPSSNIEKPTWWHAFIILVSGGEVEAGRFLGWSGL